MSTALIRTNCGARGRKGPLRAMWAWLQLLHSPCPLSRHTVPFEPTCHSIQHRIGAGPLMCAIMRIDMLVRAACVRCFPTDACLPSLFFCISSSAQQCSGLSVLAPGQGMCPQLFSVPLLLPALFILHLGDPKLPNESKTTKPNCVKRDLYAVFIAICSLRRGH
ncbi:hypothetical protein Q8A67_003866 [Cirrhinus molitorella]|uniref:Uncharacterized protein n=1 Tax=Cirrhinus molitorella TaxID=172907 RepID=A0AA88U4Y5_9TELE|nr:hypothetical protein Q8A67_003866 [Cirrhinus molitorella]